MRDHGAYQRVSCLSGHPGQPGAPARTVTVSSLADGRLTVLRPPTWTVVVAPLTTVIVSPTLVPLTVTVSVPPAAFSVKAPVTLVKLKVVYRPAFWKVPAEAPVGV